MRRLELPETQTPATAITIISIAIFMIGSVLFILLTDNFRTRKNIEIKLEQVLQTTEKLDPGDDAVINGIDNTLYLPYDAIDVEGKISIISRPPAMFNLSGSDWILLYVVNVEFWGSDGTLYPHVNLSQPAHVCFTLNQDQWQDYLNRPTEYQVQYYAQDQTPVRWEPIPLLVYPERLQLCGETTHLSIFGLATKPNEDGVIPVTGGATPTVTGTWSPTDAGVEITFIFIPKTSTPTPLPTNTAIPSATSHPTITTTAVPSSTNIPIPTATNVPTATEEPSSTPEPPTLEPTDTQEPTDEPTDVPTDAPTEPPVVEPTVEG